MSAPARRRALVAAGAAVVLAPFVLAWGGQRWLRATPGFEIRRVTVEGAIHVDPAELTARCGALGANAFALDLREVRRRVLGSPWVASVEVRRVLPHELRLAVTERVPAATEPRDGRLALLDGNGRVIDPDVAPGRFPLPRIVGLDRVPEAERDASRERAAATLAALRLASLRLFQDVVEIDASREERLVLKLEGHPPLWAAGPGSARGLAEYGRRARTLRAALGEIEYVDARWRDRLFAMRRRGELGKSPQGSG
jgi:hypothetical protein